MVGAGSADRSGVVRFSDVAIVGGGCYGTFYAGQLLRARRAGRAEFRRLLVVDRDPDCRFSREIGQTDDCRLVVEDWDRFFDRYLAQPVESGPPATVVPSPLMPHLMYQWLERRARARWPSRTVRSIPLDQPVGTPYDTSGPDGTRYVSYADWTCPVHCIEPATCPVIRAPRTWEIAEAAAAVVSSRNRRTPTRGPVLFSCRHRVFGVGMFDVAEVRAGDAAVAEAGEPGTPVDLLVGTVSSCHGALTLLALGPGQERGEPAGTGRRLYF